MISAFFRAFAQLSDPATRKVVWQSIGLSVVIFIALWVAIAFLLTSTALFSIGWLEGAIDVLGGLATLLLTWFLFPAVVTGVGALLLDSVVGAVEARHYPHLPAPRNIPVREQIVAAAKFLGVTVGFNLLALPFLLVPPLFPFIFLGVNGYLLGREYFELVALRRLSLSETRHHWAAGKGAYVFAGVGFAFLLTVPLLNLIAPVIAAAAAVHLFEQRREARTATNSPTTGTPS